MKKIISIILILMGSLSLNAQAQNLLSLEEAVHIAISNNYKILQAKAQSDIAKANYQQSAAAILPQLDFNLNGIKTNDPLSVFGFKLKQEIVTQADFAPDLLNDPLSTNHFNMQLQLQIPIINLDGIYQRKAAKLGYEAKQLQLQRIKEFIRYSTISAYYQLDLQKQVISVVEESLNSAIKAYTMSQNHFDQGLIKEADLLIAKVHVSDLKLKLKEVNNQYLSAQESFAHLLGIDLNRSIEVHADLTVNTESMEFLPIENILNRSDLQAYQKGIDAQFKLQQSSTMSFIPRINAFGSTEWNDRNFLGTQANNYTLGATLSWKLFNGGKNIGTIKKSKAVLNHAKEAFAEYQSQSELEYKKAQRNLKLHFSNIQTSKLNYEHAVESKRMITNRYEQGLEKTIDLLYAENLASSRELSYLQSQYQYQIQKFYLEFLMETEIKNQ